jgi:hypothetical protein
MSSGGHRLLLVTISFQLTNNNNRYVVNDDKQGVCHIIALPFTLKSILRQKKNDGNSNISPCKNIILNKNPLQNPSRYHNSITNLKFQHKPKYSLSKIVTSK